MMRLSSLIVARGSGGGIPASANSRNALHPDGLPSATWNRPRREPTSLPLRGNGQTVATFTPPRSRGTFFTRTVCPPQLGSALVRSRRAFRDVETGKPSRPLPFREVAEHFSPGRFALRNLESPSPGADEPSATWKWANRRDLYPSAKSRNTFHPALLPSAIWNRPRREPRRLR